MKKNVISVVNSLVKLLKKIKWSGYSFSLYDLLKLYLFGILKGALTYRASAIAYSFFIAIFPFLLFILNLIPYVPIKNFQQDFLIFINDMLPAGTHQFFSDIFFDIANKKRAGLLSSVFVLSIFLMANGVNAIFGGFEYSYQIKKVRSVVKQYLISLIIAVIMAIALLLSVIFYVLFRVYAVEYLTKLSFLYPIENIISIGKVFTLIMITYLMTSILYYFGTIDGKKASFFSVGSLLTTTLFVVTTYLFGIYIENFSQYNQLYGSIGALLIFLFYIWLNSNILLLGFEFNISVLRLKEES